MIPGELTSRNVILRPVSEQDRSYLYGLELEQSTTHLWSTRGRTPQPGRFLRLLQEDALACMLCVARKPGQPFGVLLAYRADIASGICWVALTTAASVHTTGLPMEAFCVFVDYCLNTHALRRVYIEVNERNLEQFKSLGNVIGTEHGRYREHDYVDGAYLDRVIFSISKTSWDELVRPWLVRLYGLPAVEDEAGMAG